MWRRVGEVEGEGWHRGGWRKGGAMGAVCEEGGDRCGAGGVLDG